MMSLFARRHVADLNVVLRHAANLPPRPRSPKARLALGSGTRQHDSPLPLAFGRSRVTQSPSINRQVRLKSRPNGVPQAEHFEITQAPMPHLRDGQFLVRNHFLSVEPAMRGWVNAVANYSKPVGIGDVMRSYAAGEVIASKSPHYGVGDHVMGMFGWQDYAAVEPRSVVRKIIETDLPLSLSLGILGLNGVTAYFALLDVGRPRAGDTVVVSTAAGAVGAAVGQIAKIAGCRTIGIAGGPMKTKLCVEAFGYDAAIDYKAADFEAALASACAGGVDIYFDNTSGAISDAVLKRLAIGARVVICGTASVPSWDPPPIGPRVERHLLTKRAQMSGFLAFDYQHRYEEAIARLAAWLRQGNITYREDILAGIDACPDAIARLYRGENSGKLLVRLQQD
jgi:NADPH-dependent curcumin reductase